MMNDRTDRAYTPDEALLLAMETLRSTNPAPSVVKVIDQIEQEIQDRKGMPAGGSRKKKSKHHRGGSKVPA